MAERDALLAAARTARANAHAPYSNFKVGAAIQTTAGALYAGCNVENVAYPEGTCAEAGAIAAMVAQGGAAQITQVVVIADSKLPITPCGGCRQKLAEFGTAQTEVHLANLDGIAQSTTLGAIFPGAFSADHMEPGQS